MRNGIAEMFCMIVARDWEVEAECGMLNWAL